MSTAGAGHPVLENHVGVVLGEFAVAIGRQGAGKASTGKVNLAFTKVALGEVLYLLPEGADPKDSYRMTTGIFSTPKYMNQPISGDGMMTEGKAGRKVHLKGGVLVVIAKDVDSEGFVEVRAYHRLGYLRSFLHGFDMHALQSHRPVESSLAILD
jgi:hypothetical protein